MPKMESAKKISSKEKSDAPCCTDGENWYFTIYDDWFDGYERGGRPLIGAVDLGSLSREEAQKVFDGVVTNLKEVVSGDTVGVERDCYFSLVSNDSQIFHDARIYRIISCQQLEETCELEIAKSHSDEFYENDYDYQKGKLMEYGFTSSDKEEVLAQAVLIARTFHRKADEHHQNRKSRKRGRPPLSTGPSVDTRLIEYLSKNPSDEGRSATFYAKQLDCSPSAIRGTKTWKICQKRGLSVKIEKKSKKKLVVDDIQSMNHAYSPEKK